MTFTSKIAGVTLLVLVQFCCGNFTSAAVCLNSADAGGGSHTTAKVCRQFCPSNKTCNFSCSFDDCQQHCLTNGCKQLSCFESKICNQHCSPCSQISCQANECHQKCRDCTQMKCKSNESCEQTCIDEQCDNMLCEGNGRCTQKGYGKMTCDSASCEQTCSANSCNLTCNAKKCKQTCNSKDCSMVCTAGVEECIQNCTAGSCSFKCDPSSKCIPICPECSSGVVPLRITYITFFFLILQSIFTIVV